MPLPMETLLRTLASPVPTQTVSGCLGSIAMSPIEMVSARSNIGCQVTPPLVVLKRPPEPVAAYNRRGLPGTPSIEEMRPPIAAGPILRHSSEFSTSGGWAYAMPKRANHNPPPNFISSIYCVFGSGTLEGVCADRQVI